MRRLFILLILILFVSGCEESMKAKEEKAEQLRRESEALLAGLSKSEKKEETEESSQEKNVSESENSEKKLSSDTENKTDPVSSADESEPDDGWKNPYADYSDYEESPLDLSIKKRYEELFSDREKNPNFDSSSTSEQIEAYEKECDRIVAEEFNITPKEASAIYVKSVLATTKNSKAQYDIFEYLKKYFSEEEMPLNISNIEINRDPNKPEEAYIVLIHGNFTQKQKPENANVSMSIIAQNIAIHLQLMEHVNFSDLVFFFRDDYNQRDLKLTAEWDANFRGFFKTGIWY